MRILSRPRSAEDVRASPATFILWGSSGAFTNMPAALTELPAVNKTRRKVDLTNYTQARVGSAMSTRGAVDAEFRIQYATDGDAQTTWAYLDGVDGPKVNIGTTGGKSSPWIDLVADARKDVWIRLVGINGDGAIDPVPNVVELQVR